MGVYKFLIDFNYRLISRSSYLCIDSPACLSLVLVLCYKLSGSGCGNVTNHLLTVIFLSHTLSNSSRTKAFTIPHFGLVLNLVIESLRMQSVNFLLDSFGLGPFSIDQILMMLDQHGIPSNGKENASATQKFINKIISMGEKNGGMTLVACTRVLRAVIENSTLSELEGCILRSLDFSKSVILHSPDGNAKACCNYFY